MWDNNTFYEMHEAELDRAERRRRREDCVDIYDEDSDDWDNNWISDDEEEEAK